MPLTGEPATACFRIFQEALTNVARHARATRVTASVEPFQDGLLLRVTDNGVGMRLQDGVARGHLGLVGMRERAELLSARLDIVTAPGEGTTMLLRLPAAA
jgi:signal transduction histidine kinase